MGIRIQPRDIEVPEDDPFRHDLLGRRDAVDTLTHLVGNIEGPCVLAVDAAWGAGKTTFLNIWAQHLRNQGFPVVEFNAWETDFSEEPFVTLSSELTEGLRECAGKPLGGKIHAFKKTAKEVLRHISPGAIRVATARIPIVGSELGIALASYAKEKLSQHQEARKSVAEFKRVLQGLAAALSEANGNHPLMVTIDELDRCRPSYAVELLEVAKHVFSVDGIVFVLAVNRSELANSVRALYGSGFDAEGYMRRFFDVDFVLPEPERSALINALLSATRIDHYFEERRRIVRRDHQSEITHYSIEIIQNLRTMLLEFFGTPHLSLRTVAQAVHRLGLLFASLRSDQLGHASAATVALLLRTMDQDLYDRFNRREATDLDVVDAIFKRPGLNGLRHQVSGLEFEAMIILAGLEDNTSYSPGKTPICSPLFDRYVGLLAATENEKETGRAEYNHAKAIVNKVTVERNTKIENEWGRRPNVFDQAVQRLELLTATLDDDSPSYPSSGSS